MEPKSDAKKAAEKANSFETIFKPQQKEQKAMDFLPADQKDLQTAEYWKKFFENEKFKDGFEWYASFEDLTPYLKNHIKAAKDDAPQSILVPGCGNSDLSEKLITKLGISNLTVYSVDYEEAVVKKMEETKPGHLALKYAKGDVTNLDTLKD